MLRFVNDPINYSTQMSYFRKGSKVTFGVEIGLFHHLMKVIVASLNDFKYFGVSR